jgi:hypothetical protein
VYSSHFLFVVFFILDEAPGYRNGGRGCPIRERIGIVFSLLFEAEAFVAEEMLNCGLERTGT